jgi:PelA/Pel-15E family pectate lyase
MKLIKPYCFTALAAVCFLQPLFAQGQSPSRPEILSTMMRATRFMADSVSENGGFLSHYLPDFSRSWGEMEAYPTMIWVQNPGTVSMGNTFLDCWKATGDDYYYQQARKAASALVWGQLPCGGWNYFINFGGLNSTLKWYHTIGQNGWRLEEFQHYYGNATFDDEVSSAAALFLLRFYLAKLDPAFKPPLEKALDFVLKSQYPLGGWPQRFPLMHDFHKNGDPDYTSCYTFNDNVLWQNIKFLTACYATLNLQQSYYAGGNTPILNAIRRAMNFLLISQQPRPYAGWAQQYTMDLKPAAARSYEPASLDPQYTATNIELLLKCYEMTGDKRYIQRLGDAITWLKTAGIRSTPQKGVSIYPKFVDPVSGVPLYTHRIGEDVIFGHYYDDHDSTRTVAHYGNFRRIDLGRIERDYQKIASEAPDSVTAASPLQPAKSGTRSPYDRFAEVMEYLNAYRGFRYRGAPSADRVEKIIRSLDGRGRWLVQGEYTSHPYNGNPSTGDSVTHEYMTTFVGDRYDTSPYRDTTSQLYISTSTYTRNMEILIAGLNTTPDAPAKR